VYVRSGTYNERLSISANGTAVNRILFEGYQSETAVIGDGVYLYGDYITINKFDIEQTTSASRIVRFDTAAYCIVNNVDIDADQMACGFYNGANNNTFQNATCIGTGGPPHYTAGSYNNLVINCSFVGITASGYLDGTDNTIEDCLVKGTNNGTDCWYPFGTRQTVRHCVIYNFSKPQSSSAHTDIFQIWHGSLIDFTVENCVLGSQNWPDGEADPSNRVWMMSADDMDVFSGLTIRNNIIMGGGAYSATIGGDPTSIPITGGRIYNNVIYNNISGSLKASDRRGWHIYNNICVGNQGCDGPGDGDFQADYNFFQNFTPPAWQGENCKTGDPKFVDPDQSATTEWGVYADYRLQAGSPAIDCAYSTGATALDKESDPRYDDPATANTGGGSITYYDMGALEYQGLGGGGIELLAGTSAGLCTTSATTKITKELGGQSNGGSSATAVVDKLGEVILAGQANGSSTAGATLSITCFLGGQSNGSSTAVVPDLEFVLFRYPESDADTNASLTYYPASPATHWDKLDDPWSASDDDNTYVIHLSNDTYVTVDSTNFDVPTGATINVLRIKFRIKKMGSGSIWPVTSLKVGANWYSSGQCNPPEGVWTNFYIDYFNNPDTSLPWTVDQINGVGANALSTFGWYVSDADPDVYFTQVSLRVLYNKGAPVIESLAGVSDGVSTAGASLSVEKEFNGTAIGNSTVNGLSKVTKELVGLSTGVSTATAFLSVPEELLEGVTNGGSTAGSVLAITKEFTSSISGNSIGEAALELSRNLAGTSVGLSTTSSLFKRFRKCVGSAVGTSTVYNIPDLEIIRTLVGLSNGVATVTCLVDVTGILVGQADGVATAGAVLNILKPFVGSTDGTSTAIAILAPIKELVGQSSGSSICADLLLKATAPLTGISSGISTVVSNLLVTHLIGGFSIGGSTTGCIVEVSKTLVGISDGGSIVGATIEETTYLNTDTIQGDSTVTATIEVNKKLSSISSGSSTCIAVLDSDSWLAGISTGGSLATMSLEAIKSFDGAANGLSTAIAILGMFIEKLSGITNGGATSTAFLDVLKELAGAANALSTVNGSISPIRGLDGATDGSSTTAALIKITKELVGISTGTSTAGVNLEETTLLSSTTNGTSLASGNLNINKEIAALSEGSSTTTMTILETTDLAGTSVGISTVACILKADNSFSGATAGDSTAVAAPIKLRRLECDNIFGDANVLANIFCIRELIGQTNGLSTAVAALQERTRLYGSSAGSSTAQAEVNYTAIFASAVAGVATAGAAAKILKDFVGQTIGLSNVDNVFLKVDKELVGASTGVSTMGAALYKLATLVGSSNGIAVVIGIPTGLLLYITKTIGCISAGVSTAAVSFTQTYALRGETFGQTLVTLYNLAVGTVFTTGIAGTSTAGVALGKIRYHQLGYSTTTLSKESTIVVIRPK
jgi:hypothetical protein